MFLMVLILTLHYCNMYISPWKCKLAFNPLIPKSDQPQFSSCYTNAYSTPEVMRIKDKITQGEFTWYFTNFSQVLFSEKYGDKIREFALWYYGL